MPQWAPWEREYLGRGLPRFCAITTYKPTSRLELCPASPSGRPAAWSGQSEDDKEESLCNVLLGNQDFDLPLEEQE